MSRLTKKKVLPDWFPIDRHAFGWDAAMYRMGLARFTHKTIAEKVSDMYGKVFTPARVSNRLRKMGVRSMDLRNDVEAAELETIRLQVKARKGLQQSPTQLQRQLAEGGRAPYLKKRTN